MAKSVSPMFGGVAIWAMSMSMATAHFVAPAYVASSSSVAPVYVAQPTYAPPTYPSPTYAPPVYAPSVYAPPVYAASSSSPPPDHVATPTYAPPVYVASSSAPPVYPTPTYVPPPPVYVASSSIPPVYATPTYVPPPVVHTGCPSSYGGAYSNQTVHTPNHFNLIVRSSIAQAGYLYLTSGGKLREDVSTAATFVISNHQLGKVVAATDPSPFFVGAEHSDDQTTSLGLLPYCTSQSIIKKFELVKCECVAIGTGYFQHYLKWSDERFTAGNGEAVFGVDGVCGGADPADGSDVIARLSAPAGNCNTGVKLYALPA